MIVKITPALKVRLIVFNIVLMVLIPVWLLSFMHYSSTLFPTLLSSQTLIPSPQTPLQSISQVNILSMLFNVMLLSVFYFQHILMATLKYKMNFYQQWTNYPIYQNSVLVIAVFSNMTPQYIVIFELNHFVNYFFLCYGLFFFVWANISMQSSLLIPFSFKTLMSKTQLKIEPYNTVISAGITTSGMYGWMRHPMQSGCIFIIVFGSPIFTVQKVVYAMCMIIGITIGVMKQEQRLIKRYTQYKEYMQKVKARFIPYLL